MINTSPKIDLSPEQAKKIAEIICKEIENSLKENDKRYKLAERCEHQYQQMTKWDASDRECDVPWKGASNYFVALSEWITDAIWARLMNILFSQQPYMKAKGVESSDVANQDSATEFTDMVLREKVKLYENIGFFFKQMIKLPFATLKYCWVKEYDSMILKEQAMTFVNQTTGQTEMLLPDDPETQIKIAQLIANGYTPGQPQDVWVSQDVELVNQPKLQYIRACDYVYPANAKRGNRLFWEGDRFWMTINEMVMKVKQEAFIADSVEKVRANRKDSKKQGVDAIVADREAMVECFHWYGRLPFNANNEIDLEDPEAIEQEVYCDVAYKEKELLDIEHWYYRRKPYPDRVYIRGSYEDTENFEGRSMLQKLYKTQTELNDFHKTLMDNAWLAMQKIFVKKSTLTGDSIEKPTVYPGALWEEENTGDIRVLEVGDIKTIGMELEGTLLQFAERISNINNWNLGTRPEGGKPTATEFAGTIQEGNIGREPLVQRAMQILVKICQWTLDYYSENMPENLERRILGETGEPLFMGQYWKGDDIIGQFDFIWQGTSQNSDQQWNIVVANDLQEKYLPQPMVAGNMLATWEILKQGLVARGMKDWQKILPPKQAIIAEMQRMKADMQTKLGPQNKTIVPPGKLEELKAKVQNAGKPV